MKEEGAFWIVEQKDGTFAVEEHRDPWRTVLDGLTLEQAKRLQEYLTDLLDNYDKIN